MSRQSKVGLGLLFAALASLVAFPGLQAKDAGSKGEAKQEAKPTASPVKAKPLGESVQKGLAYLVSQQRDNGGWPQGGGWRSNLQGSGRVEGANVSDPADVANTCIATLALIRAGNTPREGPYAKNVAKAVDFICGHVEEADKTSLYVTDVRDTQVQVKIGPYVDTFLTAMVLAELKGKMPDDKGEKRTVAALDKVIAKMEKNQQKDGTFAGNNGWASVLSQGLASKGLNRAAQNGFFVKPDTLARDNAQSAQGLDLKTGTFAAAGATTAGAGRALGGVAIARGGPAMATGRAAGTPYSAAAPGGAGLGGPAVATSGVAGIATSAPAPSDAGVAIYNTSARAAGLQETVNSLKQGEQKAKETLARKDAPKEEKEQAKAQLDQLAKAEEVQKAAVRGIVAQVEDRRFVGGFGSNGGEEFLSYMNISETLMAKGGPEWEKWDRSVTENLNRVQDKDGGWSGQHCITGRTFTTAAALLTLMADRAPIPACVKQEKK